MNNTDSAHILSESETARESLACKLAYTLRAYDADQHKRSLSASKRKVYYNVHALVLYHEALERAMSSLRFEGVTVEMALAENFTGYLLKALFKAYSKIKGGN
jgi:hypothetical protein